MATQFDFEQIVSMGKPTVLELERLSLETDSDKFSHDFINQSKQIECLISQTYGIAASITRNVGLAEVVGIWKRMGELCNRAIQALHRIKERNPYCGADSLYDKVLDYKLACDKRCKNATQEIECQGSIPPALFPAMK